MRIVLSRVGLLLVGLAAAPAASAQIQSTFEPLAPERELLPLEVRPDSTTAAPSERPALLVVAGTAAWIGGTFVGGHIGSELDRANGCEDDYCGLTGALNGALVGSTLATALAVHIANRGRGSLGTTLLATGTAALGGFAAALVVDEPAGLLLVPVAQIMTAVLVERATTPKVAAAPGTP